MPSLLPPLSLLDDAAPDSASADAKSRVAAAVRLKRLIERAADERRGMALPLFLGEGAAGAPIVKDLAAMPHLLVAGTTGAGKTSCLEAALASLLMTRTAEDVKLILVDPMRDAMEAFRDVPHLALPVQTDVRRVPAVLEWLVAQMEERSGLFARLGVNRIEAFNALQAEGEALPDVPLHMPHLVVVVDELADLMMIAAKQVEVAIQRLARKSRAVGIHLLLATQRPSVDVLTGLLKSNLPSRIAFKVAANVDSRTILDQPGAEKLLGKGDMLLMQDGSQHLVHGQGTCIAKAELKRILGWLREHGGAGVCDEGLFNRAAEVVIAEQRGSVSLVQRKLEVGFSRAGKLMDALEVAGIVGPQIGARARQVLVTLAQWRTGSGSVPPPAPRASTPEPLFHAASLLVLAERRGSVERLRDLLGVSWVRAASLMQALEAAGVVERRPETGEWRVRMSLREWRKKRGA